MPTRRQRNQTQRKHRNVIRLVCVAVALLVFAGLLALNACTPLGKVVDCMANPDLPCEDEET